MTHSSIAQIQVQDSLLGQVDVFKIISWNLRCGDDGTGNNVHDLLIIWCRPEHLTCVQIFRSFPHPVFSRSIRLYCAKCPKHENIAKLSYLNWTKNHTQIDFQLYLRIFPYYPSQIFPLLQMNYAKFNFNVLRLFDLSWAPVIYHKVMFYRSTNATSPFRSLSSYLILHYCPFHSQ
jgi:hypothetical protein